MAVNPVSTSYACQYRWLMAMLFAAMTGCAADDGLSTVDGTKAHAAPTAVDWRSQPSEWRIWQIGEVQLAAKRAANITIALDFTQGKVSGHDGCNRFMGKLVIDDGHGLQFHDIAATKRGCPPGFTPHRFYETLSAVRQWQYTSEALRLFSDDQSLLMVLR